MNKHQWIDSQELREQLDIPENLREKLDNPEHYNVFTGGIGAYVLRAVSDSMGLAQGRVYEGSVEEFNAKYNNRTIN